MTNSLKNTKDSCIKTKTCTRQHNNLRAKSKIYTPKRDDEHPRLFHMGVPPPPRDGRRVKRADGYSKIR